MGLKLKLKRIEKGYKTKDFCEMIGLSRTAYWRIETGQTKTVKKEVAEKLINLLGISESELIIQG